MISRGAFPPMGVVASVPRKVLCAKYCGRTSKASTLAAKPLPAKHRYVRPPQAPDIPRAKHRCPWDRHSGFRRIHQSFSSGPKRARITSPRMERKLVGRAQSAQGFDTGTKSRQLPKLRPGESPQQLKFRASASTIFAALRKWPSWLGDFVLVPVRASNAKAKSFTRLKALCQVSFQTARDDALHAGQSWLGHLA